MNPMKEPKNGLTKAAKRPRLLRGDERSRVSKKVERERKTMQAGSDLSERLGLEPFNGNKYKKNSHESDCNWQ
jgi:hypothetical protein